MDGQCFDGRGEGTDVTLRKKGWTNTNSKTYSHYNIDNGFPKDSTIFFSFKFCVGSEPANTL